MKVYKNVTELIGNTPLMELKGYCKSNGLNSKIFAKIESLNPAGSIKDRVALAMIEDAESKGILKKDSVIIEPTSGNTGIGIASVCRVKGYKVILTMPSSMSIERQKLLKAYGAELVLTEPDRGMEGAVAKAKELAKEIDNSFIPSQFTNQANVNVHKQTTGPEIWKHMDGKIDFFVAGVGTGGTLTGVGEYLKTKNKDIKVIAVEPYDSPLLSSGKAGSHGIQGIGANFIPEILNQNIYDEVIAIKTEGAYGAVKKVVENEGLLIGISSGANIYAATIIAQRKENKGKNIVAVLPDSGERYLSTDLFE